MNSMPRVPENEAHANMGLFALPISSHSMEQQVRMSWALLSIRSNLALIVRVVQSDQQDGILPLVLIMDDSIFQIRDCKTLQIIPQFWLLEKR